MLTQVFGLGLSRSRFRSRSFHVPQWVLLMWCLLIFCSKKACKYFDQGRGSCPFGAKCLYLHALPDGTRPEPDRPRKQLGSEGSVRVGPSHHCPCRYHGWPCFWTPARSLSLTFSLSLPVCLHARACVCSSWTVCDYGTSLRSVNSTQRNPCIPSPMTSQNWGSSSCRCLDPAWRRWSPALLLTNRRSDGSGNMWSTSAYDQFLFFFF